VLIAIQYVPQATSSFPQLISASQFIGLSPPPTLMDSRGIRILAPPNSSACHTQPQRLLLPPPSVLPSSSTIPSAYPSFSPPQRSPSWPPQSTPLNPSSVNLQAQADCRVISEDHDRNFFANGSSTAGDDDRTSSLGFSRLSQRTWICVHTSEPIIYEYRSPRRL